MGDMIMSPFLQVYTFPSCLHVSHNHLDRETSIGIGHSIEKGIHKAYH